jgi:hypothetical protein
MGLSTKRWAIVAGSAVAAVAFVGLLGVAAAQTPTPPAPTPEVGTQKDVNLTPIQMYTVSNGYLVKMDQGAASVRTQLTQAREGRDVVKVLCLNDKLNQIDVGVRSARDRHITLKAAVDQNDLDRARHEFTIVVVLHDRVMVLVGEANQCIGEETGFVGDSKVIVTIDPSIPDTDPTLPPNEPITVEPPVLSIPPPASSPTQ